MAKTLKLNIGKIGGSPQTHQQSVSQAGMEGRALQNVGQQIVQTGLQVGSIVERRRKEEARDLTSHEKSKDRIYSQQEAHALKEQFHDDSIGYTKAVRAAQKKRQDKVLKGITNPAAKQALMQEFELSAETTQLNGVTWERTQFTENSKVRIGQNADMKAAADMVAPQSIEEFVMDYDIDMIVDVDGRDLDPKDKQKARNTVTDKRMKGIINGYMKGGELKDFSRAEKLVTAMGDRLSGDEIAKANRFIDSERQRLMSVRLGEENQERKLIKEQFQREIFAMRDIFTAKIENPDADISDELKIFAAEGKITSGANRIRSREKMDLNQRNKSSDRKFEIMEALAESERPTMIRDKVIAEVLKGQLSAEDGHQLLDSIEMRITKGFKGTVMKESNSIIKAAFLDRMGNLRPQENRDDLNKVYEIRNDVIQEFGVDAKSAAEIALKVAGKRSLVGLPTAKSVGKHNQNTIEGILAAKAELKKNYMDGKIKGTTNETIDEFYRVNYRILREREAALKEVPTLKELRERI